MTVYRGLGFKYYCVCFSDLKCSPIVQCADPNLTFTVSKEKKAFLGYDLSSLRWLSEMASVSHTWQCSLALIQVSLR